MVAIFFTSTTANLAQGFAQSGYNKAGMITEIKMQWDHNITVLITGATIFGLMLGSLLCNLILPYGRLKSALIANGLIIVATVPQMWLNVSSLVIGRFLLGFGSGLMTVICGVYMAETIPAK